MTDFTIRAWNEGTLQLSPIVDEEGKWPESISLRGLPGARALHVELLWGEEVIQRLEVPVDGEEAVTLQFDPEANGEEWLYTDRSKLELLREGPNEPNPPIGLPTNQDQLDLVVLIDGTLRTIVKTKTSTKSETKDEKAKPTRKNLLLLGRREWTSQSKPICELIDLLFAQYPDHRATTLAFGDHSVAAKGLATGELEPKYLIYPESTRDRRLRPSDSKRIRQDLLDLPATPGGDYVDALAEALAAVHELRFREGARRLVLVVGESPGPSIAYPLSSLGDFCSRKHDIETEAARLHRKQIEVATLYFDPKIRETAQPMDETGERLLRRSRRQYRELASLPQLAFELASFDPQSAAAAIVARPPWIAHRASYGVLLSPPAGQTRS